MVPFGGWELAVQFAGIKLEHRAVREEAGLFDISHMGQIAVEGAGGGDFLDYLLPARIRELAIGQMLYAPMCNDRGGCVDDVVVYRLGESSHLLVVNASRLATDWQWVNNRAAGRSNIMLENLNAEKGMVAVQGPQAEAIVSELAGAEVAGLGYYHCQQIEIAGIEALLSRNGYTGEDGFEIICAADRMATLWEILRTAGAKPCGLGARDTLRLEMGFCLYGHELDENTTPLEAGLGWTMDLEKETEFVGATTLGQLHEAGGYRRLRGFRMLERGIPRSDYLIVDQQGASIGRVTSGTQSPVLDQGIGLGYLDRGAQKIGSHIFIEMRGKKLLAEVVKLPFVQAGVKKG